MCQMFGKLQIRKLTFGVQMMHNVPLRCGLLYIMKVYARTLKGPAHDNRMNGIIRLSFWKGPL